MKNNLSRMEYLTGYSNRKGVLGLIAFPQEYSNDVEFSMFYTLLEGKWRQVQFKFDIVSLTYLMHSEYKAWWLLGKRGEVVEIIGGNPKIEKIETAGTGKAKHGYLSCIRTIGSELFICGYNRQVYKREKNIWTLISSDIMDNSEIGFESIDGFSPHEIYVVGDKGEIWYSDGVTFKQCESPTKENLSSVRCVNGKVWICGDNGIVLVGDKHGFEKIHEGNEPSENWWSIEEFNGDIYLAGNDFLGKLQNGNIEEVKIPGKDHITTNILQEKDGVLWSIGEENIFSFDGKNWEEFVVPENQ